MRLFRSARKDGKGSKIATSPAAPRKDKERDVTVKGKRLPRQRSCLAMTNGGRRNDERESAKTKGEGLFLPSLFQKGSKTGSI